MARERLDVLPRDDVFATLGSVGVHEAAWTRWAARAGAVGFVVSSAACTAVPSPPAAAFPMVSPSSLGSGVTRFRAQASAGIMPGFTAPGGIAIGLGAGHGLHDVMDFGVEARAVRLFTDRAVEMHPLISSGRISLKYTRWPGIALSSGLGGGGWAGGGFLSPDVAVIFGRHEPGLRGFLIFDAAVSVPFARQPVAVGDADDMVEPVLPTTSWWLATTVGFRFALADPCAPVFMLALSLGITWAGDATGMVQAVTLGLEL